MCKEYRITSGYEFAAYNGISELKIEKLARIAGISKSTFSGYFEMLFANTNIPYR
ncbi:MAG: hypothetical protein LWX56_12455 [Ignavibacteria bacterium]|nr:hypothetical protein [Ignavibacteria bacterium]